MGWVSDNVRKTRVTRAISAFFRMHLHIAKKIDRMLQKNMFEIRRSQTTE